MSGLASRGWERFAAEPAVRDWAAAALASARQVLADPAEAHWYRHGRTWFAGVDSLPNDTFGRVPGGPVLAGAAVAASGWCGGWHRAQVSAVFPGYPRRDPGEGEAAHRYRRLRDAAHVDGVIAEGADRRRFLREPHAFVLGLPLTEADPEASPLVVWEGSHEVIRQAFRAALVGAEPDMWDRIDVTEAYHAVRRLVFETCPRVTVPGAPGEAFLLHRLTLHGVAPWGEHARAASDGRVVAYFRPPMPGGIAAWLDVP